MTIQKAVQPTPKAKSGKSLSYQYFLQEGDRYYQQHQDWAEGNNLLEDALNSYYRAQEQAPDEPNILVRMAKVFYLQGHFDKCERFLQNALKRLSRLSKAERQHYNACLKDVYFLQGLKARHDGKSAQAIQYLIKSIQAAGLQSGAARWELFHTCYRALQISKPINLVGTLSIAGYSLFSAMMLAPFQKSLFTNAYQCLALPQHFLARIQEEFSAPEKALHRYLDLHHQFPGAASFSLLIGAAYRKRGQFEQARHWFESVIQRHPTNLEAYCHLAQLYETQEDYTQMSTVYRQLLKLQPNNPHIWCNLANAAYYSQAYREALKYYENALRLGSGKQWKSMVAQSIANIYIDYIQNNEAALAYYRMAQDLDPTDVENYIQIGLIYFQKEDYDSAENVYQTACRIAPGNARLYSNLGYLRWMAGDTDTAIELYTKAIELDITYEIPRNNLGVIYLDTLGQIQKSIELFRQAIELNENYALAHYNLGRAYSFLNQRLEAAQCFRIAQDINQFSKELDNEELTARINHLFDTVDLETTDLS